MGLKIYAKKAANYYYWWLDKLNKQAYIRKYPKYLHGLGVKISENPGDCWISPTVFLDSAVRKGLAEYKSRGGKRPMPFRALKALGCCHLFEVCSLVPNRLLAVIGGDI